MEGLISKILKHPTLVSKPPVLLDIGASGEIHAKWKQIASYSICIAFDADSRDFSVAENEHGDYKKLYTFNCIVSNKEDATIPFYLTKSPYCSSALKPATERLKNFIFAPLFEIDKVIELKNKSLSSAIKQLNLDYIDWFKSDSQGTDLRLFKNLPEFIQDKVVIAEFEPGIMDAYEGEDKMYSVMEYLDQKGFLLCDMDVKKVQHISEKDFEEVYSSAMFKRFAKKSVKALPFWAELTYLNRFEKTDNFTVREYLLGCLFAMLQGQYSYAMQLSIKGNTLFKDPLFDEIGSEASKMLKKDYHSFKFFETVVAQAWAKMKG